MRTCSTLCLHREVSALQDIAGGVRVTTKRRGVSHHGYGVACMPTLGQKRPPQFRTKTDGL